MISALYGKGLRFDSSRHVHGSYGFAKSILLASDATLPE